jgi:glycosyltransferase involved in cell wall biosynthesis
MNKENIEKLKNSLEKLNSNENVIYFLTYDTKNNPRASVKYIYDLALTLKENGSNVKILVEDKTYQGVQSWLGDKYDSLDVLTIKDDKVEIKIEDVVVVPEYYSNVLENLSNIKCNKVILVQQKEYIFETLPIGSKWLNFGFDKVITTTEFSKKYINDIFKYSNVYIIPPIIDDNFKVSEKSPKPTISILCRDRSINKKIISEFYLKYPQLRWINFKDMNQLTYTEFSDALKECFVSVWVDDDSTFGTFPLESMKCEVPVIGKIPKNEPDWLGENGMWTYDENKITEILGKYVMAWIEGVELTDEVKQKMKDTLLPYDTEITKKNIISVFESFKINRVSVIEKALEKLNNE